MKISTLVLMFLFVGMIFFVFAGIAHESNDKYNTGINTSAWEGKYDYSTTVNQSVIPLQSSIADITNPDKGWLARLGAGFTGVIQAVTLLPTVVFGTQNSTGLFQMGGSMITNGGSAIGLPVYIISVLIIALIIWGIFKLVEFFQRWYT